MEILTPDINFIKDLKKQSGADLKACMQCGTCSVVCELSPEENPYPRKEMIWASWGLEEKLMKDPDIWLCHQCGDCSTYCPRGVKPGDVLTALREKCIQFYVKPRFLFSLCNKPGLLPFAILLPAVIIALILFFAGTLSIPEGPINYSSFFPHAWLNGSFSVLVLLVVIFNIKGLKTFTKNIKSESKKITLKEIITQVRTIASHKKFSQCNANKYRNIAHKMVFWGFMLLLLVTLYAIIATITGNYPITLWHPAKITGNFAAIILVVGSSVMILKRLKDTKEERRSTYSDWFFLITFFCLSVSGVFVELARFLNWESAYYIYFGHLVLVWMIIIYVPYTKFAHTIFRTVAMVVGSR